jgi:hypothetical protein
MRGVSLKVGTAIVLDIDSTLVYVEAIEPTYAGVVAFPQQEPNANRSGVFTPGRVGMKKISPYSSAAQTVPLENLSPRNREFLATFEALRAQHGPLFVDRTPEELAAMTVVKATPVKDAPGLTKAEKRAARKARRLPCTQCGEPLTHANHPADHPFAAPEVKVKEPKAKRTVSRDTSGQSTSNTTTAPSAPVTASRRTLARYTLTSTDLTKALAQPRGDKYKDGNRSHRVVMALGKLPEMTGTIEDIIAGLANDGGKAMTNPEKVVKRTMSQLTSPEFGAIVTKS